MAKREFDAIVYGASGYTGRLVAEHLRKTHGTDLKWAMAGRSPKKLAEVRGEIGAPDSVALVIADSDDPPSLETMANRADVIISTAGPYQLYGSNLVAACARTGTDYVDLTGESHWIAQMLVHDAEAKRTGARLVFSCGFDSIPFDLGVYYVEEAAKEAWGHYAARVRGRVRGMRGGLSGGTLASGQATMMAAAKDPAIGTTLRNPFALTPGFTGPAQPDGDTPYDDTVTGSWVGPFMMAGINTKAVHRTNFLLGQRWGADFQYDEMQMMDGPPKPEAGGGGIGGFSFGPGGMPKPGEGPSKDEREAGWYDLLFIAEDKDGRTLRASVKGDRDPGYGSTSKILAEAALALQGTPRATTPGGCWSPAAAMADALLARLPQKAGLTFAVEG
jgi:short subunit dehydrogenase-like uncharacterized protein